MERTDRSRVLVTVTADHSLIRESMKDFQPVRVKNFLVSSRGPDRPITPSHLRRYRGRQDIIVLSEIRTGTRAVQDGARSAGRGAG